ncbi:MAG: hypothetical protein HY914_08870 [Desulfomonile tiedjei]|nr:hypothetical protein [Desulfomonile tiedjei]
MRHRFAKEATFYRPTLIFEQLEERIVLDASCPYATYGIPQDTLIDPTYTYDIPLDPFVDPTYTLDYDSTLDVSPTGVVPDTTVSDPIVNQPPVNTVPASQTVTEDTLLVFSAANGNAISVADPDAGSNDIQVTLWSSPGSLSLGSTDGITVATGTGDDDLVVSFIGTLDAINSALEGMSFTPQDGFSGPASLVVMTTDLGSTGDTGPGVDVDVLTITVTPETDTPSSQTVAVTLFEDTVGTIVGWGGANASSQANSSISITSLPGHGTLFIDSNYNNRLESGEEAALGQVISWTDAVLQPKVKYVGALDYNGTDTLAYSVVSTSDSETTATGTVNVTVTALNDAPVATVPGAQSTLADTALTFDATLGNGISVSDVDAGTGQFQLTLVSIPGSLTLGSTNGLTFGLGDGTADSFMVLNGTMADVNAALNGMSFTPLTGYSGSASVTVVTNDMGNTGTGGPRIDVDTVSIAVGSAG